MRPFVRLLWEVVRALLGGRPGAPVPPARVPVPPPTRRPPAPVERAVPGCSMCAMGCCGRHQSPKSHDASWRERETERLRPFFPRAAARPWSKERLVETPDGPRPECFGRHGYGDGRHGDGACDRARCHFSHQCWDLFRRNVEARDPRMAAFDEAHRRMVEGMLAEHPELRGTGEAGRAAMRLMQARGDERPLEEAFQANHELGRLDSGEWSYCAGCVLVVRKGELDATGHCPSCQPNRVATRG